MLEQANGLLESLQLHLVNCYPNLFRLCRLRFIPTFRPYKFALVFAHELVDKRIFEGRKLVRTHGYLSSESL